LKEIHFKVFAELHYDDNEDEYDEWWQTAPPVREWMVACEGVKSKNDTSLIYYISRSFLANHFFVSKGHEVNATYLDSIICSTALGIYF